MIHFRRCLVSLLVLFAANGRLAAQESGTINFVRWYNQISNPSGPRYYPTLLERFERFDTTLTAFDIRLLTYGCTLQPEYDPYAFIRERALTDFFAAGSNWRGVVDAGRIFLRRFPVSIAAHRMIARAYDGLGMRDSSALFARRCAALLNGLTEGVTGSTKKEAFFVAMLEDVDTILQSLGCNAAGKDIENGDDVQMYQIVRAVSGGTQKQERTLYFNITRPMRKMSEAFTKPE